MGGEDVEKSWKSDGRGGVEKIFFRHDKIEYKKAVLSCYHLLKTTNLWIKCIILDINIK